MPNVNDGTATDAPDTATPAPTPSPLEGFSAAMLGNAPEDSSGEPKEAAAVETLAEDAAPEVKEDNAAEKPATPKTDDKPAPAKPVNFDGFSDKQKATWERLLKAGHATPDEVEAARGDSLRQNLFSKKTEALARRTEAFEKTMAERTEDVKLLDKIRNDDRLYAMWLKMARGEVDTADTVDDEIVDGKKAKEIALNAIKSLEAEKSQASAKEQADFDKRRGALTTVISEAVEAFGVTPEVLDTYLAEEAASFPEGVDPVRYAILNVTPSEMRKALTLRHEAATAKAEAATLREQLNQRTSKQVQASKQSLPPVRRVAPTGTNDPWKKTLEDLGVADFSDVQGLGFRGK